MEEAFIRPRNITIDRYMLLKTRQSKGESFMLFCRKLKERSKIVISAIEMTLWKEIFSLLTCVTQKLSEKSYLWGTVNPGKALGFAINMAFGHQNPFQIADSRSASPLNALLPQRQFGNANFWPNFQPQTKPTNQFSRICGLSWSPNHIDKCIA